MNEGERSCYSAELFYLQDQADFPFRKAVTITAVTLSRWCTHYSTLLLAPASEDISSAERSGALPEDLQERESMVQELVKWVFENSEHEDLFALFLSEQPLPHPGEMAKFDHHDDTCCWFLNLTALEFGTLQSAWAENGLPSDLFYHEDEGRCIPYPGKGFWAWIARKTGWQKCFTPKQWEDYRNSYK